MGNKKFSLSYIILGFFTLVLGCTSVRAQVVPDNTLGSESSLVKPDVNINGFLSDQIDGGAIRGSTLLHSFQEFSVSEGRGVYFTNPTGIENILSRVTGANPSNILGRLGVIGGNANLFLINPNGIIFGTNASLDINGSFLGSTANSIELPSGIQFNAKNPQPVPLLTINVPIGLEFSSNPAPITVEGTGHNLFLFIPRAGSPILGSGESLNGLRTAPGKTIALVGGNVNFDGGVLTATSGRIEVGSIDSGVVDVNSTASGIFLNYGRVTEFQDIKLDKQALLDASGFVNGNIFLQAKNVDLINGSFILVSNFGNIGSGKVTVKATDSLTINRNLSTLGNFRPGVLGAGIGVQNFSTGKGADITISARELNIQTAFGIVTETFGSGLGGNISLNIHGDSLHNLDEPTSKTSVNSGIIATFVLGNATGNAGNLTLSTDQLFVENGATVASETFGLGNGGIVNILASESIKASGVLQLPFKSFLPSFLGALATSFGDAGNVTLTTGKLILERGGRVDSTTLASGSAGRVTINASESVDVIGKVPGSLNPTLISSSANRLDPAFTPFYGLSNTLNGASNFLSINTNRLNVRDGARISVRNDGSGEAGDLKITANSINLENQGAITADTAKGQGGNITLQTDNLLLRQNSEINATAGGNSFGGNITIDTNTLVALENSDISANSLDFRGGTVTINAQGIFGTEFRDKPTAESDITATGRSSELNGVVQITTPDIDFTRATAQPGIQPESPEVASVCPGRSGTATSQLINAGTGGIPASPTDPLNSSAGWYDNSLPAQTPNSYKETAQSIDTETNKSEQIIEAQGWKWNADGTLSMTLEPEEVVPYSSLTTPSCHHVNRPSSGSERK